MSKGRRKAVQKSSSSEFARARAAITKTGNIRTGLAHYKFRATAEELRRTLPLFLTNRVYFTLLWPDVQPRTPNAIGRSPLPWVVAPFEQELTWQLQSLLPFAENLKSFLVLRERAERQLLLGQYDELRKTANEVEEQFGLSIWLIELRTRSIQLEHGFLAQKEYVSALVEKMPNLASYIISWLSFRTEQNVSASEFRALLHDVALKGSGFDNLLCLALGLRPEMSAGGAARVLAYLQYYPLIDRYIYLVATLQCILANQLQSSEQAALRQAAQTLSDKIDDPLVERLLVLAGGRRHATESRSLNLLAALETYTLGDYKTVADMSDLAIEAANLDVLHIAASAAAKLGTEIRLPEGFPNALLTSLTHDLSHVLSFSDQAQQAFARLEKAALMHASASWASSLSLILARQSSDERGNPATADQRYYALRCESENPIIAASFDSGAAYLNAYFDEETYAVSAVMALVDDKAPIPQLSQDRADVLLAMRLLRSRSATAASDILAAAFERQTTRQGQFYTGILLASALLQANRISDCSRVCATLLMMSTYVGRLLPVRQLISALIELDGNRLPNSIPLGELHVSIVFDYYSRFIATDRESERADAFNDFLRTKGITFASEIESIVEALPVDQAIHFLKNVCVPAVLDQSLALASTRAVEDERAKVIVEANKLLAKRDEQASAELLDELREIRTRQVVRETALELDQSKVYVNIEGIKKTIGSSMKENWQRYNLLSRHAAEMTPMSEITKAIKEIIGDQVTIISLNAPITERNKLFLRMVGEIRDLFTTSREFGLDSNLSTNIRHGFILRELRGPFVGRNLVTNMTTASGEYQRNSHWLDRANDSDCNSAELNEALARFSGAIDNEIELLTRRFLRIRSDQVPEGVFAYDLNSLSIQLLQSECDNAASYDEFVDAIINYLWSVTDDRLTSVRKLLREQTLQSMLTAISQLQAAISVCCRGDIASSLSTAMNLVRPELIAAVDRVSNWFSVSGSKEYHDYALRIAFEASLETVRSYYRQIDIEAAFESNVERLMRGWTLPHLTRLFTIIVENAAFHSGIVDGVLAISVCATILDDAIDISVTNALSDQLDEGKLRTKIGKLNADFGRDAAAEFIRLEGGSGYPKIWKILKHDLRRDHELEASLTQSNEFRVQIIMDSKGVLA